MAVRPNVNTEDIGSYGGHSYVVRKLQYTVHLPINTGFSSWIIGYALYKKINDNWVGIDMAYVPTPGYNASGVLEWQDMRFEYADMDDSPAIQTNTPASVWRVSAQYLYKSNGDYNLDKPNQIKYSDEFKYYK